MNQDLPKPMLDALARQPLPAEHPSADVLTAFAEKALAGDEYRRTADHLARCGECREVVFRSIGAADQTAQAEEEVAARGARRRWMPRLVWGASIAAGVLVVATALMYWRIESAPSRMQMASRAAGSPAAKPAEQAQEARPAIESKSATAPQTTPEIATTPPAMRPQPKTARAKPVSPKGAETPGVGTSAGTVAGAVPEPAKAASTAAAGPKATPTLPLAEPNMIAIGSAAATTAPAAPRANSFAAVQGGPVGAAPGSADKLLLNPQTTLRSVRALHPQWRITADGHLEHLTAEGWTRVLADHLANFRVVSVVGSHVWVGGSGGALFHSPDDGQNWAEVALSTPSGRETAAIVSIQFDDAQHGIVTMDSGTRCNTTDGGWSWICVATAAGSPK